MPRVAEKAVYSFDELDHFAKERARSWYRENCLGLDYNWWDGVFADFEAVCDLLGVKLATRRGSKEAAIYFSGFCSQDDGASFEGNYRYKKGALKAIKAYAPMDKDLHKIALTLQDVQRANFYQIEVYVGQSGRYHSMSVNVDRADGVELTCGAEDCIEGAMRDLAGWLYSCTEAEYEYLLSDEQVDEAMIANEYSFDEDGRPY